MATVPLAFVDLETTGGSSELDRITEIAIVTWDGERSTEWSQLLNPGQPIPPFIENLTGISNAMVAGAPPFRDLAEEIAARLAGYRFVAHNARFDHGFLKAEFARCGIAFQPEVLCTVKYSRRLYPEYKKHNLDSLIERHALHIGPRHRALSDARAIYQFWRRVEESLSVELRHSAVEEQLNPPKRRKRKPASDTPSPKEP